MIYNKISCLGVGIVKDGNVSDRSDSGGMKNNAQVVRGGEGVAYAATAVEVFTLARPRSGPGNEPFFTSPTPFPT